MTTSPEPELTTTVVGSSAQVTWADIHRTMSALLEADWPRRPVRMYHGPGVDGWLKRTIPVVRDAASPFGIERFGGIQVCADDCMAPGAWKIVDQYGTTMHEGTMPDAQPRP